MKGEEWVMCASGDFTPSVSSGSFTFYILGFETAAQTLFSLAGTYFHLFAATIYLDSPRRGLPLVSLGRLSLEITPIPSLRKSLPPAT